MQWVGYYFIYSPTIQAAQEEGGRPPAADLLPLLEQARPPWRAIR